MVYQTFVVVKIDCQQVARAHPATAPGERRSVTGLKPHLVVPGLVFQPFGGRAVQSRLQAGAPAGWPPGQCQDEPRFHRFLLTHRSPFFPKNPHPACGHPRPFPRARDTALFLGEGGIADSGKAMLGGKCLDDCGFGRTDTKKQKAEGRNQECGWRSGGCFRFLGFNA